MNGSGVKSNKCNAGTKKNDNIIGLQNVVLNFIFEETHWKSEGSADGAGPDENAGVQLVIDIGVHQPHEGENVAERRCIMSLHFFCVIGHTWMKTCHKQNYQSCY